MTNVPPERRDKIIVLALRLIVAELQDDNTLRASAFGDAVAMREADSAATGQSDVFWDGRSFQHRLRRASAGRRPSREPSSRPRG